MDACRGELLEAARTVQHDDEGFGPVGPAVIAQAPSGGDGDGAVDRVERDGMRRGQGLQRGDAGHDTHPWQRRQPRRDADR